MLISSIIIFSFPSLEYPLFECSLFPMVGGDGGVREVVGLGKGLDVETA